MEYLIKIVKGHGYSQKDIDYTLRAMRRYTREAVEIQMEFVDSMLPTKAGKRAVVVSKVSKDVSS